MSPTDVVRAQLLAAKAGIEAALALLGAPETAAPEVLPCRHPPAMRVPMPTGGNLVQFMCRACMTIIDGKAESDGA